MEGAGVQGWWEEWGTFKKTKAANLTRLSWASALQT